MVKYPTAPSEAVLTNVVKPDHTAADTALPLDNVVEFLTIRLAPFVVFDPPTLIMGSPAHLWEVRIVCGIRAQAMNILCIVRAVQPQNRVRTHDPGQGGGKHHSLRSLSERPKTLLRSQKT